MSWECGDCGVKEQKGVVIETLCHHCGKMLCDKHRIVILDNAFSPEPGPARREAYHCSACKAQFHPYTKALRQVR